MVAADGGGCPTEGYAKRDFSRRTGAEATGIRKTWREGGSAGSGQRRARAGDGAAALGTGDTQVNGGPHGEMTRNRYAGRRRGTARWAVDTVRRCNGRCRRTGQDADSPSEGSLTAGGADRGDGNNTFVTLSSSA